MIVEIIGAPGVGKTSMLNKLIIQDKTRGNCFFSPSSFLRQPRCENAAKIFTNEFFANIIQKNPFLTKLFFRPPTPEEKRMALLDKAPHWNEFLEFCLDQEEEDNRPAAIKLIALQWLVETVQLRAMIEQSMKPGTVVFMDEPLGYRLSMFSRESGKNGRIRNYYFLMPLPDGVIHLSASVESLLQRISQRRKESGKFKLRHQGMDQEQLIKDTQWAIDVAEMGASILEVRGVPVLWLDAEQPIKENVIRTMDYSHKLFCLEKSL